MNDPSRVILQIVAATIMPWLLWPVSPTAYAQNTFEPPVAQPQTEQVSLTLWRDPAFMRQLTESYRAETEVEPRVTEEERKQLLKIFELISSDKIDEAVQLLGKGRGDAASAVFDFTMGNIHFQRDQIAEAAAAYQVAVTKYPKFLRAWRNLGQIHMRQNEFEIALTALTRVVELGGHDAITFGLMGFAYSSVDNNLSAESAYRMAILLDPATMDWKLGLARSLFKQERYADAASLCGQLITKHPDRADLWLLQANAFIGMNQPMRAAENYELVDRLGNSTTASLNMLGDIYVNDQLYDLAVRSYVRAMMMRPRAKADRPLRAAKVLTGRGANEEAQRLIESINAFYGDELTTEERKDLLKLRARLAVAQGAGEEEAKVLEQIVALDPLDGDALILLGQYFARSGDSEKAIFHYERAASIEKYEADAKVRHAQLLVTQGKYAEALPLLRSAQQLNPRENVQKYLEQVERVSKAK